MQVLIPGVIPEKEKPLWVGMRIRCPKCRALIEFDENDRLCTLKQYGMRGPVYFDCQTPNCESRIWFELPRLETPPVTREPYNPRTNLKRGMGDEPKEEREWPSPKPIITCEDDVKAQQVNPPKIVGRRIVRSDEPEFDPRTLKGHTETLLEPKSEEDLPETQNGYTERLIRQQRVRR